MRRYCLYLNRIEYFGLKFICKENIVFLILYKDYQLLYFENEFADL